MKINDIILKKRQGKKLTRKEIDFFVSGYNSDKIPDYQAAALLMAIMFVGLDKEETYNLTIAMAQSGEMLDLSSINGLKIDKHSTGGVGDKITLIASPIVASLGIPVAKMSGRGLGFTGGTVDKLNSIPGYKTEMSINKFVKQVNDIGIALIGQTTNVAPCDKKLYSLRDVTATVDNISLISASIMSKKLASGGDAFLFDVKVGRGAFTKNIKEARELATYLTDIASQNNKKSKAMITNMEQPLGNAVGNWLEIVEVIDTLKGNGPKDVIEISLHVSAHMLCLAEKGTFEECYNLSKNQIENGKAFRKFKELIQNQGGDVNFIDNPNLYKKYDSYKVQATKTGYIQKLDAQDIGMIACNLGAGRNTIEDEIDPLAGIFFHKKVNDYVKIGEPIATVYTQKQEALKEITEYIENVVPIESNKTEDLPLFFEL
ncbi:MAG: thymidine phosphorylase [Defluviitaleaceae bacterium]|nr:thymidine phosphorylase [Defluviitaleaceae bacterium]